MTSVLIIDDNRAKSALLKISLVRKQYQVRQSQDIGEAVFPISGELPDLVLINQAIQNHMGWELFNNLKQLSPDQPAMVYAMERDCIDDTGWICRAVEAVCEEAQTRHHCLIIRKFYYFPMR
ncbi:response regulator [uncultured Desulfosarcina sp.]|uniref:response regulator n=1 Tax=uncultured Desulfosarcina sp. TaxID=218289 RepID=UPI0029C9152F|nr:response regulator [uncultured Desulfosarcina sp.]